MTNPPVCDYEGSDYQTSFWDKGGREYEDRTEAIASSAFCRKADTSYWNWGRAQAEIRRVILALIAWSCSIIRVLNWNKPNRGWVLLINISTLPQMYTVSPLWMGYLTRPQ